MQSVSSMIWTRVAVSISYDDNDYTRLLVIDIYETYGQNIQMQKTFLMFSE